MVAAAKTSAEEQTLQEMAEIAQSIIDCMDGVRDKATADAAVARLVALEEQGEAIEKKSGIPREVIRAYMEKKGLTDKCYMQASDRLYENRFYGSEALADMFGYESSVTDDENQLAATPEVLAEVQAALTAHVAAEDLQLGGGPGTSEETAWVMPEKIAVSLEYDMLSALPGNVEHVTQVLIRDEATQKSFDVHKLVVRKEEAVYAVEVWFDITAYVQDLEHDNGAVEAEPDADAPTSEQRERAMQECVAITQEAYRIIMEVEDKTSADAAAERLAELRVRINELAELELRGVRLSELLEYLEAAGLSGEMLQASQEKLEAAGYYGSEALMQFEGFF